MSTFTLAISCLTTSNLPWLIDLTFQVPMQYCSLQHWTWLQSPVISTTRCCFCFGSISSIFLELFLHWSPIAYWAPTDLGNSSFSIYHFAFSHCAWLSFIELDKAVVHAIRLVSFLWLWFSFCLLSDGDGWEVYGSFLMGKTDWGGNWVLFWWTVLSKSLIQFSPDGWGCVPSL